MAQESNNRALSEAIRAALERGGVEVSATLEATLIEADRLASFGSLATSVAHEINNPLAYVLLHLSSLRRRLDTLVVDEGERSRVGEQLDEALEGAERVRLIVADLLSLARSEPASEGPADVGQVVRSALKVASGSMRHRAVLEAELSPVPPVGCGAARLGQVLLNLLINASQCFEGRGDATTNRVDVRTGVAPDGQIRIEVEDNGPGIPEEIRARIFSPFFTTKPTGVGTGLGLSICQSIVSSCGGDIRVDSRPGAGTRVIVTLPPAGAGRRSSAEMATTAPAAGPRGRVLVVDDEPLVARALVSLLGSEHQVEMRCDGAAALELLLDDAGFDLVVCDLMMPGLTGMELFEEVRRDRPAYARRFIFMTGGAYTEKAAAFSSRTRQPLVSKPFDMDELLALVREQLVAVRAGAGAG